MEALRKPGHSHPRSSNERQLQAAVDKDDHSSEVQLLDSWTDDTGPQGVDLRNYCIRH